MYVLEGSRLGAKFLLRSVETSDNPLIRAPTAYLRHGYGGRLWTGFLTKLEKEEVTLSDQAEMVNGALDAFEMFYAGASA
jgi:heme oxygenase (biliverdin-IX-beta and delta-forming)